jgi:hypothetical protein
VRRIQLTILTVIITLVVLILVILSPFALTWLQSINKNWSQLSNIGQTYGAISALVSSLALGGVIASLIYQGGPPGRTRRRHGGHARPSAGAPGRTGPTPVGWREDLRSMGPPSRTRVLIAQAVDRTKPELAAIGSRCAPESVYCPARPGPVKSACGVGYADLRLLTEPARESRTIGSYRGRGRMDMPRHFKGQRLIRIFGHHYKIVWCLFRGTTRHRHRHLRSFWRVEPCM